MGAGSRGDIADFFRGGDRFFSQRADGQEITTIRIDISQAN
jgi:hypothetical protein